MVSAANLIHEGGKSEAPHLETQGRKEKSIGVLGWVLVQFEVEPSSFAELCVPGFATFAVFLRLTAKDAKVSQRNAKQTAPVPSGGIISTVR